VIYGERELKRGAVGPDVAELQIRLAGFRGTIPDGDFGPGTERQVMEFQRDFMKMPNPHGRADGDTLRAINEFADKFPLEFDRLRCPCGECGGFGRRKSKGEYPAGQPKVEAYHLYEYPGMHRMLMWAVRAVLFHMPQHRFIFNSGYRCSIDNRNHDRTSTNHHGKAIDLDIVSLQGECHADDRNKCNGARACIQATGEAQIGWAVRNRKALEPENIAPTWVHYDVRCYEAKYLDERFFCTSLDALNNRKPIHL
jgi:hypothetical protein